MRHGLLALSLAALVAAPAGTALADESDFVGYNYTQDYKRDYDRGFFFGAEAWLTNVRNLHFEPVISSPGTAIGGRLLDTDYNYDLSGRYEIGYQANRRIGRFTFRYWDFNESASREEIANGLYIATDTHPVRGDVLTDSFAAENVVDVEFAEAEWRKNFAEGRKFSAWWSVSAQAFEVEYSTDSWHFNDGVPGSLVHVSNFSSAKGIGGRAGIGGQYQFSDRFAMGGALRVGFASSEQDGFYLDENDPGDAVGFIDREDTELTTMQFEGDLNFQWRIAGGFELDFGYRYLDFQDVVAQDRFVDNSGKFVSVEQASGLAFEGPYLGGKYTIGVKKIDSDGDGVLDVYDDCADTPAGAWVNEKGCPRDLDEDGVYDGIDRCPGTDFGTRVDEWGCGVDSDGDGVFDGLDLCPNTPGCAHVDGRGCPKDSDGDGVSDGCDACPNTVAGAKVNADGCQVDGDTDGDTVPDSRDKCPGTPRGAKVDADGCEQVISMTLHFASDSAEISEQDKALLDRIAEALAADGGQFEVQGHCDSQNSTEYNQGLSDRRANAVKDYLVGRGVSGSHLNAVGYSELRPIATNDTEAGRAMNRRVEIVRR